MEQTEEKLIISMPKDSFTDTALENLKKLIENKEELFARAFLSSYLTTVSKWGEDEILARAEMLSDELITIWKYPKKD